MENVLGTVFGPAGAGKDTLLASLEGEYDDFDRIVNDTTRKPRPSEIDGVDYNFVSSAEYKRRMEDGEYLTSNYSHDRHYGVLKSEITRPFSIGKIAVGHFGLVDHEKLWALDPATNDCQIDIIRSVLLLTPSFSIWLERMGQRLENGFINKGEVFKRARAATQELSFAKINLARFAIIQSTPNGSSVREAHNYIKFGIDPEADGAIIDEQLSDFESYLTENGES